MKKLSAMLAAVVGLFASAVASVHAALPAAAETAFETIETNVTDILAVIWPIVAMATGGFVLIKLFKKGASKAT